MRIGRYTGVDTAAEFPFPSKTPRISKAAGAWESFYREKKSSRVKILGSKLGRETLVPRKVSAYFG
jgi:hypothetical protein